MKTMQCINREKLLITHITCISSSGCNKCQSYNNRLKIYIKTQMNTISVDVKEEKTKASATLNNRRIWATINGTIGANPEK